MDKLFQSCRLRLPLSLLDLLESNIEVQLRQNLQSCREVWSNHIEINSCPSTLKQWQIYKSHGLRRHKSYQLRVRAASKQLKLQPTFCKTMWECHQKKGILIPVIYSYKRFTRTNFVACANMHASNLELQPKWRLPASTSSFLPLEMPTITVNPEWIWMNAKKAGLLK